MNKFIFISKHTALFRELTVSDPKLTLNFRNRMVGFGVIASLAFLHFVSGLQPTPARPKLSESFSAEVCTPCTLIYQSS